MASFDDVLAAIGATGDEFRCVTSQTQPPDAAAIDRAAVAVGLRWPAEYRAFLARFGALYLDVEPGTWPRPRALEIRPRWQMAWGLWVHGVADPPDLDVVAQTRALAAAGVGGIVPVLRVAGSAREGIGYDEDGQLVRWSTDAPPVPCDGALADEVLAAVRRLIGARERLRAEPIAPGPDDVPPLRATVTLELAIAPDALVEALGAAIAELSATHTVSRHVELLGGDDDEDVEDVPADLNAFADALDDVILHLHVDGRELDVCGVVPIAADAPPTIFLQSVTDPAGDPVAAAALAALEAALVARGRLVSRSTNR